MHGNVPEIWAIFSPPTKMKKRDTRKHLHDLLCYYIQYWSSPQLRDTSTKLTLEDEKIPRDSQKTICCQKDIILNPRGLMEIVILIFFYGEYTPNNCVIKEKKSFLQNNQNDQAFKWKMISNDRYLSWKISY